MLAVFLFPSIFSCTKSKKTQTIDTIEKSHRWFYFTDNSVEEVELPKNVPDRLLKPWTEQVRISSASSNPGSMESYAVVNRLGILKFSQDGFKLFTDGILFDDCSADGLVYSSGKPVFYLFRSTFFNDKLLRDGKSVDDGFGMRTFLMEFDPGSNVFLPLVSYENLGLGAHDQITGYFWNGKSWACSSKNMTLSNDSVEFSYFKWEPVLELSDMSPAISSEYIVFSECSENEYRSMNTPKEFSSAPAEAASMLSSLGSDFPLYLKWNDGSGTSPVYYFQEGNGTTPVNGSGQSGRCGSASCIVFSDGTTYINGKIGEKNVDMAFRLPRLPQGFVYGDFVLCGKTLYVSWEECEFFETGKSGFIQVDLAELC